ncbi:helix-loop-helix DNA-binding domain-containing protein [Cladorrhinum samala]|uniref:Helix-loop-helix DNA-binding domain-containing protein n=1 Tax=Cladorrhinum samala TaxID=585594 RepID=A0AAV9HN55_9PEZI|nr:helix-loop-helix DNA-binding domain-containing protein [Cladorrhinum samala]
MSGLSIDPSMSFDPYPTSFDASQLQSYPDFSPASILDNLEDFGTDFTSDSAASPISPISPVLSASSYGYPATEGWGVWDTIEHSPEPESLFKADPFTNAPIVGFTARNPSLSPAINPMDLAIPPSLFQSAPLQDAMLPLQQQQHVAINATVNADEASKRYPSRSLKRKSSTPAVDDEPLPAAKRSSPPPAAATVAPAAPRRGSAAGPKKTAHNMIEKRYRTNLNDKIAQLRDAVPSLRLVAQRIEHPAGMYDDCDETQFGDDILAGLPQAAKLNKATILAKATEYISQLEKRNQGLETENNALRGRMEGLEMMLMSRNARNSWN